MNARTHWDCACRNHEAYTKRDCWISVKTLRRSGLHHDHGGNDDPDVYHGKQINLRIKEWKGAHCL